MGAAPTVFGPDRIRADVIADFAVRAIVGVEVLVGEWQTERHYGAPRVVIGRGKGTYENPAETPNATNGWIDVGSGQVARPILGRAMTFPIWVHSIADASLVGDEYAEAARQATDALADLTAAAVARTRGGLPILPWPTEPIGEARGEFVCGSMVRFDAKIWIPVFDDPSDTMTADEVIVDAQLDLDGTLAPTTPEIITYPES